MGKALVPIKERLKKKAEEKAATEQSGMGGYISTRGGVLRLGEEDIPGNELICVVLNSVVEKTHYPFAFNEDAPLPPKCFALGLEESGITAHESIPWPEEQGDSYFEMGTTDEDGACKGCPFNEWGSADTGNGKACKDRRRLAVMVAGTVTPAKSKREAAEVTTFDSLEEFEKAEIAQLKVSPTSVRNYQAFMKGVARDFQMPTFGVIASITLVPHPKFQYQVEFEVIEEIEDEDLLEFLEGKSEEVEEMLLEPFSEPTAEELENAEKAEAKSGKKTGFSGLKRKG